MIPMANYSIFPSITPDNEPFVDDSYSKAELERMEWQEIRAIATEYDTDEINGRSDRQEMESWLEGKQRL